MVLIRSVLLFLSGIQLALTTAIPDLNPSVEEQSQDAPAVVERSPSAGLAWGPYEVSPLKLYITKPHFGYAGPKVGNAPHINAHVDRKGARNKYVPVVNLHVVKYNQAGKQCLYMWDSVSKKVVFDKCFDNFREAAKEGVEAAKEVVDKVMDGVGFVAKIAATVALGVALVAAILLNSLNPIAA